MWIWSIIGAVDANMPLLFNRYGALSPKHHAHPADLGMLAL